MSYISPVQLLLWLQISDQHIKGPSQMQHHRKIKTGSTYAHHYYHHSMWATGETRFNFVHHFFINTALMSHRSKHVQLVSILFIITATTVFQGNQFKEHLVIIFVPAISLQSAQPTTIHLPITTSINSHNINILSIHQHQILFPNTTIKPSKWFRGYDELALLENQPTKQNNWLTWKNNLQSWKSRDTN